MKKIATIVLAAGLYPPDIGGPATYAAMITKDLPQRGIKVSVQPFHTVRAVPRIFRHLAYTYQLWKCTKGADLVFATDGVSVGMPAWLVAKISRIPLFVRLGGDYAWEQGVQRCGIVDTLDEFTKKTPKSYSFFIRFLALIQRFVVRQSERVIVPSEYLKKIVSTWPGVKTDKIKVIYSVLEPLPVSHVASEEEIFTVLTAGRLVPWKGVADLIKVITHIPDSRLVIAGDGPERENLEALAVSLKVQGRVIFAGPCSKQELADLLAKSDVFVLNTAYEGLSHMLLEVMATGTPIITTAVGGNGELITDEVSGKLVSYGDHGVLLDAIKTVKTEPSTAINMAKVAKERSAEFNKENSIQAFTDLLQLYDA